jgi:hypothetical protein
VGHQLQFLNFQKQIEGFQSIYLFLYFFIDIVYFHISTCYKLLLKSWSVCSSNSVLVLYVFSFGLVVSCLLLLMFLTKRSFLSASDSWLWASRDIRESLNLFCKYCIYLLYSGSKDSSGAIICLLVTACRNLVMRGCENFRLGLLRVSSQTADLSLGMETSHLISHLPA